MTSEPGETTVIRTIGRYRAFGELGRGAMGVVYRGFDPIIGRTVALKTLSIDTADPQAREFRDRLYREAAAAGALSHPNIVTIFDIIEDGGVTAVAMEFIEGRSLAAIIAERAPLPNRPGGGDPRPDVLGPRLRGKPRASSTATSSRPTFW